MVSDGVTVPSTGSRTAVSETRVQDPSITLSCINDSKRSSTPSFQLGRDGNTWAMDAALKSTGGSSFGFVVEEIQNSIDRVFFELQKAGIFECM